MRSHYCGEINSSDIGKDIEISGWVHKRRDHGGVIFLDIRDLHGIAQAVFNPDNKDCCFSNSPISDKEEISFSSVNILDC